MAEQHRLVALSDDLAEVVSRAARAVVAINARHRMPSSGVIWRDGIVVTADHTIKREEEITVSLPDGRTMAAQLAGRDGSTDLAALRLRESVAGAELGDSATLKVGHLVLAVGRDGERGNTATMGIISALGGAWRTWSGGQIDRLVRLDMSPYPGFSGSALIDMAGKVVGLNNAVGRGLALALPVSTVSRVIDQLVEKGKITRGYVGLGMQPVQLPDTLKNKLNITTRGGVIIVTVKAGGPAERAGILIGDIVIALDGRSVEDTSDMQAILASGIVGKTVKAELVRGGQRVEAEITIGEPPRREE